jgi:hypothetical protein
MLKGFIIFQALNGSQSSFLLEEHLTEARGSGELSLFQFRYLTRSIATQKNGPGSANSWEKTPENLAPFCYRFDCYLIC